MTTPPATFEVVGGDPTHAAIAALARLLLAVSDGDEAADPDGGGQGDGTNTTNKKEVAL